MLIALGLLSSALGAPFNTSGLNGAPGSLAGFDSLGNPVDVDPGPMIREEVDEALDEEIAQADNRVETECEDVLDAEFPDRAESDRDSVAFTMDVEQICLDVVVATVPGMIDDAITAAISEYTDEAEAFVEDIALGVCDAQIATVVPAMIDTALASLPAAGGSAWRFGSTDDALRRVAYASGGGGSMTTLSISPSFAHVVPFQEETAGQTYSGMSVYVSSIVSSGHTVSLSVYSVVDGEPVDELASCAGISTGAVGEKLSDFSTDCSVTTAGAGWFDSSGDLVLAHDAQVALVVTPSAITNVRSFSTASVRPIGWPAGVSLAPYGGWKVPVASFGPVLASSALAPVNVGSTPAIWLDPS